MTKRRPIVTRMKLRGQSKDALAARLQAEEAWAEGVLAQCLADLEAPSCRLSVPGALRALLRIAGQQLAARVGSTLAGCALFGEGARLFPSHVPQAEQARAIAEAAFRERAA
jgi:hypothetical protein